MKSLGQGRYTACLGIAWLGLAATVSAAAGASSSADATEQVQVDSGSTAKPRRWSTSFVFGSTKFNDSDAHQTLGASLRIRLTSRLSVEPTFAYMTLPDSSFEWTGGRTAATHSDLMVAGRLVYDFRDESRSRVIPYAAGGAGWIQTRNESTTTRMAVEGAIPVFPAPSPSMTRSTRDAADWLWFGGAFGLRILLPKGFFVSPELGLGGSTARDVTGSAVINMGYRF